MNVLLNKIFDYIKEQIPNFKIPVNEKPFICPLCHHVGKTALLLPVNFKITCTNINCISNTNKGIVGDIVDLVYHFEPTKKSWSREQILHYLAEKYKLDYNNENQLDILLDYFVKHEFDLVPVTHNEKIPIEKAWTTKIHKDKKEWKTWLDDSLNIGVKTGKVSGITVIDFDQMPIPEEILSLLGTKQTLYQTTNKGSHYFYKYVPELPKTRIVDLKIDIENDGGQVVIEPSKVNGEKRTFELYDIQEMPQELKDFLLSKIKTSPASLQPLSDGRKEYKFDDLEDINFQGGIQDGSRHYNFMKFGGLLRKKMNLMDVGYTLHMMNRYLCNPPLSNKEMANIINSIDRYTSFDDKELAYKILDYINKIEEATSRDIKEALGFPKEKTDTLLSQLVRDGYLVKKRRMFKTIKKMQWQEEFMEDGKEINFVMPYFNDIAKIREGDLLVIGAKTGVGKSVISVNIMKRLIEQGIKPKYINLESSNRFITIAKHLGLKEGDFEWVVNFSPETMELDDNSFTIIDWLLPNDYAETDKMYKYFAEQLSKHKGILLIFVQLKTDNSFFAPNQLEMFPSLTAKFLYEDEQGFKSAFYLTKIREAKTRNRFGKIPTCYVWETKELLTEEEYHERFQSIPVNSGKSVTEDIQKLLDVNPENPFD